MQGGKISMQISDYHMHTAYSIDSQAPMEDMIRRAIDLGMREIAITDHVDYQYPDIPYDDQIDYHIYHQEFVRLKEKYRGQIRILFGVEIGIGPILAETITRFVNDFHFDFIIGSIHDIKGVMLYYDSHWFDGQDKKTAYEAYFAYMLESIRAVDDFCVLGHMDYVSRYGPYEDTSLVYGDYADIIDEILRELVARGKGLEVNTSGYRYGIGNVYPQLAILKRYKELGGQIVTIGSDAHRPQDIGLDFDKAYDCLRAAGFDKVTVYREGQPQWVRL